jgi:hypothetical protein
VAATDTYFAVTEEQRLQALSNNLKQSSLR